LTYSMGVSTISVGMVFSKVGGFSGKCNSKTKKDRPAGPSFFQWVLGCY
jgi:hypothetical protein